MRRQSAVSDWIQQLHIDDDDDDDDDECAIISCPSENNRRVLLPIYEVYILADQPISRRYYYDDRRLDEKKIIRCPRRPFQTACVFITVRPSIDLDGDVVASYYYKYMLLLLYALDMM